MMKSQYSALLAEERDWIGTVEGGWSLLVEFWIDGFTHIVISKKPNGKYQILRSWISIDKPAVSIDREDVKITDVISYLITKIRVKPPLVIE